MERRRTRPADAEQERLLARLQDGQPWKDQEIRHLLDNEFDVEYHPEYLGKFFRTLGLSYAKPRLKRPDWSDNPDEILEERVDNAFDEEANHPQNKREGDNEQGVLNDDVCTDGGTDVGFWDTSHPQPYDNSHRLWDVEIYTLNDRWLNVDKPAVGFYTINGESVLSFSEDQSKEALCSLLETIREQNPRAGILLVLDSFSTYMCESFRKRARRLGIDLVFLTTESSYLNPIEQVWKSLKRTASPIVVESAAQFCEVALIAGVHNIEQAIEA